jgi:hypothetical protein
MYFRHDRDHDDTSLTVLHLSIYPTCHLPLAASTGDAATIVLPEETGSP